MPFGSGPYVPCLATGPVVMVKVAMITSAGYLPVAEHHRNLDGG